MKGNFQILFKSLVCVHVTSFLPFIVEICILLVGDGNQAFTIMKHLHQELQYRSEHM